MHIRDLKMDGHFLIVFLLKLTQYFAVVFHPSYVSSCFNLLFFFLLFNNIQFKKYSSLLQNLLTTDTALVKIVDATLVCLRVH